MRQNVINGIQTKWQIEKNSIFRTIFNVIKLECRPKIKLKFIVDVTMEIKRRIYDKDDKQLITLREKEQKQKLSHVSFP